MFAALQRQMIFWTALLVAALGVVTLTVLLQPPTAESGLFASSAYNRAHHRRERALDKLKAEAAEAAVDATTPPPGEVAAAPVPDDRGPAAIVKAPVAPTEGVAAKGPQALELQLACGGKPELALAGNVAQIRFTGRSCTTGEEIVRSDVRNTSNGGWATVFLPDPTTFMTDYMTLSPGENKIRIVNFFKSGRREQREYSLTRQ